MKERLQLLVGVIAAIGLASWLAVTVPSAGIVVFAIAALGAIVCSVVWLIRGGKGTAPTRIWRAVWDFLTGM